MLNLRLWNIALRTAHIGAMGILLGGHAFDIPASQLLPALWWTLGTGIALTAVETGGRWLWFHQGRGLMVLGKLVLIACVPWFWSYRLPILLVVLGLASVGSHMPARFRYYSVVLGEVVPCSGGPGSARLKATLAEDDRADRPGL